MAAEILVPLSLGGSKGDCCRSTDPAVDEGQTNSPREGGQHDKQANDLQGESAEGPICESDFYRRFLSTSGESEPVHQETRDGRHQHVEKHSAERRLDGLNKSNAYLSIVMAE